MKKFTLEYPIEVEGKQVKELNLKENEDLSGPDLIETMDEKSKNQIDAIGMITGLSTADLHKIRPKDYMSLIDYMGKLIS